MSVGGILYRALSNMKLTDPGNAGDVLVSNGTDSAPTFEDRGFVRRATVTLTDAQIKAEYGIHTLVAAPDAGYRIKPLAISVRATIVGAYGNINTTYAAIECHYAGSVNWIAMPIVNDSTATPTPLIQVSALLGNVHVMVADLTAPWSGAMDSGFGFGWVYMQQPTTPGIVTSEMDGKALVVDLDNSGSGDLTGGHASNTLTFTTYYVVEPL